MKKKKPKPRSVLKEVKIGSGCEVDISNPHRVPIQRLCLDSLQCKHSAGHFRAAHPTGGHAQKPSAQVLYKNKKQNKPPKDRCLPSLFCYILL